MRVTQPDPDQLPALLNVLDGADLAVDVEHLKASLGGGDVYAAVSEPSCCTDAGDGQILGVLVLDGHEITAIAVRRRRRDQDLGTALVDAVREDRDELVAGFDEAVRPFWESLGFDVEPLGEPDRYRGCWSAEQSDS